MLRELFDQFYGYKLGVEEMRTDKMADRESGNKSNSITLRLRICLTYFPDCLSVIPRTLYSSSVDGGFCFAPGAGENTGVEGSSLVFSPINR